jgi:antitoxin HicB
MRRKRQPISRHGGSTFDSFLEEEGIREEVEAVAIKRVIAWQLAQAMKAEEPGSDARD